MNELNKLYAAMLKSWGTVIKDDGRILLQASNQEYPIRIDDMDLHLPLSNILDANVINKVFFHPACENITSKETEVFKIIRKLTGMKLLNVFRQMPVVLFGVSAAKPKRAWRQDIIDMMEPLKVSKRAVRDELNALFARMHIELEEDGLDNRFIHFKVTKGGGRGQSGARVYYKTKAIFPFYNEIVKRIARSEGQSDNQTVELNNFTVSRGALKLAAHIFQSIIPAVNESDEYEATTPTAARLISYLGCYSEIAEQLNKVQSTFRSEFDKAGVHPIELNWTEHLENLPEIWRQVPVLDYNSHNTQEETTHQAMGRNDMAGLMSVSSQQQVNQQPQQQQMYNQQGQPMQQIRQGDYDLTPPPMQQGDRYVRSEIDYNQNRVLHHAMSMSGLPVIYQCTKVGNFLMRTEMNPMMMGMSGGMMPGMGMPGMGMPGMNGMMPGMGMPGMMGNGMMMPGMNGMNMMPMPVANTGYASSVMNDMGGHNGPATFD